MERTLTTYIKWLTLFTVIGTHANPEPQPDRCYKMTTSNGRVAIADNGIIVDKSMYPSSTIYDFVMRQPSCTAKSALPSSCDSTIILPQVESAGYEATLGSAASSKMFLSASCNSTEDRSLHVTSYADERNNVEKESHFEREYLNDGTFTFRLKRLTTTGPFAVQPEEECYITVQPDYTLAAAYYSTVPPTKYANGNPVKNSLFDFDMEIVNCP